MFNLRKILDQKENPRYRELFITLSMIKRNKFALVALGVIITTYLIAAVAPIIAPYDPYEQNLDNRLAKPSKEHLLGTDQLGRDIFSRLLHGSRISLSLGIVIVVISSAIGIPLGAVAGYYGGKVDEALMRITDLFMSWPSLVFAMLLAYILGRGMVSVFVALSLVYWTRIARLVRGTVLSEREKEYAIAAKVLGKNDFQILFNEILPNSIQPIMVMATMRLGTAIVSAAGLSFIGVGIQPPRPEWGLMISRGRMFLRQNPYYAIVPGIVIMIVVLAFNILGDTLRDALDPQLRRAIR